MEPFSRAPEGETNRCPVCGHQAPIDPWRPLGDTPCPNCGHLLWFDDTATLDSLEFIPRGAVIWRLEVANKTEAIAALVDRLLFTGNLRQDDVPSVMAALTQREELGSTAIGGGVAIPHTKHPSISQVVGAVGYAPFGIDFNSSDGQPVHTVVMLLSSPDRPSDYLRALEKVAQRIRQS